LSSTGAAPLGQLHWGSSTGAAPLGQLHCNAIKLSANSVIIKPLDLSL